MSYEFELTFWPAANISVALTKAHRIVKKLSTPEMMMQQLGDNIFFAPSRRVRVTPENWRMALQEDYYWLNGLFTYRFVYWKKQKLLALLGHLPEGMPEVAKTVYFQNSCSQDYEFSRWPTNIPFFVHKVNEFQKILSLETNQRIEKLVTAGLAEEKDLKESLEEALESDGDLEETVNYYVRVALYNYFYETLQLHDWMWGGESEAFERFSLSSFTCEEQRYPLKKEVRRYFKLENGDVATTETVYVPVVVTNQQDSLSMTIVFRYGKSSDKNPVTYERAVKELKDIVKKYLEGGDGKRLLNANGGSIDWLTALTAIPSSEFRRAGFEIAENNLATISLSGTVEFPREENVDDMNKGEN